MEPKTLHPTYQIIFVGQGEKPSREVLDELQKYGNKQRVFSNKWLSSSYKSHFLTSDKP